MEVEFPMQQPSMHQIGPQGQECLKGSLLQTQEQRQRMRQQEQRPW